MSITVWIERACLQKMQLLSAEKKPKESGGVLMGYWGNSNEVVVTQVLGPGPEAKHDLFSFSPDDKWQETRIAEIYEQTGKTSTYLGDWHSHPGGGCELSSRDFRTLKRIASFAPARADRPIMAIIHGDSLINVTAWCMERRSWWGRVEITVAEIRLFIK